MEDAAGSVWERLRFGAGRTLNVRAGMLTGPDAAARVETWLRSRQVEMSGEVLVITGRGKGSPGGVSVVRESTRRVLARLRRAGVVSAFEEDTPGSFVVSLAPLRAMLEAPRRRGAAAPRSMGKSSVDGLNPATLSKLRDLATRALDALGIQAPNDAMIESEMRRQFTLIARTAPSGADPDRWLLGAIDRLRYEYDS